MQFQVKSAGSTFFKILCLLQVLCLHNQHAQAARRQCISINGKPGTCISLVQCAPIRDLIGRSPLISGFGTILGSVCSVSWLHVSVCCPLQEDDGSDESQNIETTSTPNEPPQFTEGDNGPLYPPQCGFSNKPHNRVVGGSPAALGAWPWIAAVGFQFETPDDVTDQNFICGGTLISSRHVVTAAHCITFEDITYVVRLGAHELENPTDGSHPIDVEVEKYTVHPKYNNTTKENDIAILRLNKDVKFTDDIHPICLPLRPDLRNSDYVHTYPFVAGWGTTSYMGPESNVLMEVQVPVVENAKCKKAYASKNNTVIDKRVLCAGYENGGKDACQGDSGGPLMFPQKATYYLIGIVSVGYRCATPGYPGIYTRVTEFLNFILSNMK